MWLATKRLEVHCDVSSISRYHDAVGILALNLPADVKFTGFHLGPNYPLGFRKLVHKSFRARKMRSALLEKEVLERVVTNQIGSLSGRTLFGWFQNDLFVREVLSSHSSLKRWDIRNPSSWFLNLKDAAMDCRPVALHIRRGDFGRSNGLLSAAYYKRALRCLDDEHASQPIWVFSDSPSSAQQVMDEVGARNFRCIQPPSRAPAAESLALMAESSLVICSNSTFSWWGGRLCPGGALMPASFGPLYGVEDDKNLSFSNSRRIRESWVE